MNKRKQIQAVIDRMTNDEIIDLHNIYCEAVGYTADTIYYLDEDNFNDRVAESDISPFEIALQVEVGLFCNTDDYFVINDYVEISTFSDIYEVVDENAIIDYILNSEDDLNNSDIANILESEE